jgi:hypothetical protein
LGAVSQPCKTNSEPAIAAAMSFGFMAMFLTAAAAWTVA